MEFNKDKKEFWQTIEYCIPSSEENAEEILSTIAAMTGALGSFIFDKNEKIFLRADYGEEDIDGILLKAKNYLAMPGFEKAEISRSYKTFNQAWETQHYDAFPPLDVGKSLTVMAPWHKGEKKSDGRTEIYIYPAGAFGTGYHESTQTALTLLEETVKPGDVILDVGTGSGILFIAALKLGAGKAIARDIDPDALGEARRNMKLNDIDPKICEISEGDLLKNFNERVDIITANILLKPNMSLLPDVKNFLKPDGTAIFSGMTVNEKNEFLSVLETSGLKLEKELVTGEWWGCTAEMA